MRRIILLTLLTVAFCGAARAQSIESFKARLAQGEAAVIVVEHGAAADVVQQNNRPSRTVRIQGYRIGLFFDNGAEARARAFAAKQAFEAAFPGIPVEVFKKQDDPYFNVSAGYFATVEEAITQFGRIQSRFPDAILKRENDMPLSNLLR